LHAPAGAPGQSASVEHACASLLPPSQALKQALGCACCGHQHDWFVKPDPVHGWLDGKVEVPVRAGLKASPRPLPEMFEAGFGTQSFDVGPNGPVPCTVHERVGLSLHVPL
jgi:hypothetical protein